MLSMYMWTHIHQIKKVDNRRIKKVNMFIQVQTYFETSQNKNIYIIYSTVEFQGKYLLFQQVFSDM